MIGQTISHYRILSQIGAGGMGVVYLAEDMRLGRRVAIKVPTADSDESYYRARFLREARSVSAINHPNIAAVYDYGQTEDDRPFIVMELVQGHGLNELLINSALTLKRAVEIVRQTAEALAEAHRRGVIHRDIKPSNVMINERHEVKVLDFGLAKQLDEEHGSHLNPEAQAVLWTKTRSDVVIGTPLYLSPEQARSLPVDARSDLFSLGALLYECIAGRPAFAGSNLIEIGAEVLKTNPPPPSYFNPRVPAELDRITLKALAKKPEDRYQSAEAMAADLRAVHARLPEGDTILTRRISQHQNGDSTVRQSALMTLSDTLRRPRLSLATVLTMLVALVLAGWAFMRLREPGVHKPAPMAVRAYERGAEAMRNGAYHDASLEFQEAVEIDDKFALAHAGLAEALSELDYGDRAKDELITVSRLVPERSALPRLQALYLEAITATAMRDFGRAVEDYREIVRLVSEKPQAYVDQGRAYERNDEIAKAIESYQQAINRNPNYATAFLRLGILYARNQNLASATPAFERAEKLYESSGNQEGRAEVFYQRGMLYNTTGKLSDAKRELEHALALSRDNENRHQQVRTLAKLSGVLAAEGNSAQAEQYAREALDLAQANGMETLRARVLVDFANILVMRGEYSEAEKYLKQAIELAQRYKAKREEAWATFTLGSVRMQQRMTDDGLRYLEQARDFYQQKGYRKEAALTLLLIGRAFRQRGDYVAALRAVEEQLQLAERVGDLPLVASAHVEAGNVLNHQEEYVKALEHYNESHAIYKTLGNQLQTSYSLLNRGSLLWKLGLYEDARELLSQATAIAEALQQKDLLAQIYADNAFMELSRRNFAEALRQGRQALELSAARYRNAAVEAERALCLAQIATGAKHEGLRSCDESLATAHLLGDPLLISSAQLARARALLENGDAQAALAAALEAQQSFERGGQLASQWLACLSAAQASRRLDDEGAARQYLAHANECLNKLQQRWPATDFESFLGRPDIQLYRKEMDKLPQQLR